MILKKNIKYYLIYFLFFAGGASIAAGIRFAYNINAVSSISDVADKLSLHCYIIHIAELIKPIIIAFLSSFTIYACAIGAASCIYSGARLGILMIEYCISDLSPFTHIAVLIFLLAFLSIFTYFSTQSAIYRSSLLTAAPSPSEILRLKNTKPFFLTFLSMAAILVSVGTAIYFFIVYFPL